MSRRKRAKARSRSLAWLGAAVLLRGSLLELVQAVHGVAAEGQAERGEGGAGGELGLGFQRGGGSQLI